MGNKYKCSNGDCVDIEKGEFCPVNTCPKEAPYKCLDGMCAITWSFCPSIIQLPIYTDNHCLHNSNGYLIPCADGRCVASSEQCRPLYKCKQNFYRCDDGSCRINAEDCPIANTCPHEFSYRCESGMCVKNETKCRGTNGCPYHTPKKCFKNGQCAKDDLACEKEYAENSLSNGCSINLPVKCGYDSNNETICKTKHDECPTIRICTGEKAIRCPDNTCVATVKECSNQRVCADNEVLCPDNTCGSSWITCKSLNRCPMDRPF